MMMLHHDDDVECRGGSSLTSTIQWWTWSTAWPLARSAIIYWYLLCWGFERNHEFDGSTTLRCCLFIFFLMALICVTGESSSWRLPPLQHFLGLDKIIANYIYCDSSFPIFPIACYFARKMQDGSHGDSSFFTSFSYPMHKFLKILANFEVCTSIQN